MVQVANVTRGVLRIRLTFQELPTVITSRRSPSTAAQIGVGLGRPSLVKVVNRRYCALARSAKVGVTVSNLTRQGKLTLQIAFGFEQRLAQAVEGPRFRLGPHA